MCLHGSPELRSILPAALIVVWIACATEQPPEPPEPGDLDGTDPAIVELFESTVAEVRQSPRSSGGWQKLGMVYQAHGRLEPALECYRQSLALEPNDARSRYFLALAEERLGRIDAAVTELERVTELEASYAPAYWRLGLLRLDSGDIDAASRSIERARELAPDDRAATLALARVELQTPRPAAAAELLEEHLAALPEDGYARFLLGRAYRQLGRSDDAKRELTRGRGSQPPWRDPWADEVDAERTGFRAELDAAIARLGPEPEQAVSEFERLRAQEPDNVGLLINLGIGYRVTERLDDSAETLREAVRLQPARPLAHLQLAVTYSALARQSKQAAILERALSHVRQAIKLRPTSPRGYAVQADLLTLGSRLDAAVASFLRAADFEPDNPEWPYHAASLRIRQSRWQDAVPLLERCVLMAQDSVQMLFMLGASQANSGQLATAEATLERALTLAPEDANVLEALEQLRRAKGKG